MWRVTGLSIALAAGALACSLGGCASLGPTWRSAVPTARFLTAYSGLEAAHAELERGNSLEAVGNDGCLEAYYRSCSLAWHTMPDEPAGVHPNDSWDCYNSALSCLLGAAQRWKRLDPARGLVVREIEPVIVIPCTHHSFGWQASDFQRLHSPPKGREPLLARRYGCRGVGLPLVVERDRNDGNPIEKRFFPEKSYFAATAILRFDAPAASDLGDSAAALEFYNPLSIRRVTLAVGDTPLASDLSAPLAKVLEEAPRTYLAGFIEPGGAATTAQLGFLEPFQRGKTPVVLIHGLFSDPQSWADLVNDLRAAPGFVERFQLWVFRYPTGQGFLQSALALRKELRAAVEQLDAGCGDPALRRIILIGHSMGGLIAKLQVTYSEELIWARLANRPLDQIATTADGKAFLAENCFFDPSPDVDRVIFIASPHCGSLHSSAIVGKGVSVLVEPSPQQAALHAQLMRDNPNTFNPLVERRFPTSIDMLAPQSPLLDAMRQMQVRPGVKLHNIVGVSHPVSLNGPSDGVVSVSSATHPGYQSVLAVGAPHAKVHRAQQTSSEVLRILDHHTGGALIALP